MVTVFNCQRGSKALKISVADLLVKNVSIILVILTSRIEFVIIDIKVLPP